jgi:hypothetical protein
MRLIAPRRVLFALLLVLLADRGGAQAPRADLEVPRLQGAVNLDGRLAESQWRRAARITHAQFRLWKPARYEKDVSEFVLRLFHDGSHLYVALSSYDRFVEPATPPENSDGLYSFSVATRAGALQHYRLRWSANPPVAAGEMISPGRWGARLRGPFGDLRREGGGYVLEFAIPLEALGWGPGDTVPVNVIVQDHDGKPGGRYDEPGVEFARFYWGSLDNEARAGYRRLRLAPR